MLDWLRARLDAPDPTDPRDSPVAELAPLRALTAPILVLAGVEVTREALARDGSSSGAEQGGEADGRHAASLAAVWAPSLIAPVAAAAQMVLLSRPSAAASAATRVLNTAVTGVGVGATAEMLLAYRERRGPASLAPLALAAAGLLALLLDRQEREIRSQRERLERRARVVERLVPQRRPRLDRIVVHV